MQELRTDLDLQKIHAEDLEHIEAFLEEESSRRELSPASVPRTARGERRCRRTSSGLTRLTDAQASRPAAPSRSKSVFREYRTRGRSPRPSGTWSSAARRPSASPPPTAMVLAARQAPVRGERTASFLKASRRPPSCSRPPGPRPSTWPGPWTACVHLAHDLCRTAPTPETSPTPWWTRPAASTRRTSPSCRAIGRHGARLRPRAGPHPHPLQRRRARHRRLRHGPGRHPRRARGRAGRVDVFADETRPLLQGARLTAWELTRGRHPRHAHLRQHGGRAHGPGQGGPRRRRRRPHRRQRRHGQQDRHLLRSPSWPRTTASPSTSRPPAAPSTRRPRTASAIPIEERAPDEVTSASAARASRPTGVPALNPAFDVTPADAHPRHRDGGRAHPARGRPRRWDASSRLPMTRAPGDRDAPSSASRPPATTPRAAVLSGDGARPLERRLFPRSTIHAPYGGVVPELASRQHLLNLPRVVARALESAGIGLGDLCRRGRHCGPGPPRVACSWASPTPRPWRWAAGLPLFGVNHVEAHLTLRRGSRHPALPYPALALVVSGGHSHLFLCEAPGPVLARGRHAGRRRGRGAGQAGQAPAASPTPAAPSWTGCPPAGEPEGRALLPAPDVLGERSTSPSRASRRPPCTTCATNGLEPRRAPAPEAAPPVGATTSSPPTRSGWWTTSSSARARPLSLAARLHRRWPAGWRATASCARRFPELGEELGIAGRLPQPALLHGQRRHGGLPRPDRGSAGRPSTRRTAGRLPHGPLGADCRDLGRRSARCSPNLTESEIRDALESLPGWTTKDGRLVKRLPFTTYMDGIRFVEAVAIDAEAQDHHPDLLVRYRDVDGLPLHPFRRRRDRARPGFAATGMAASGFRPEQATNRPKLHPQAPAGPPS